MKLYVLIVLFDFLVFARCEFYSSTDKLQELLKIESHNVEFLHNLINEMHATADSLEEILDNWNDERAEAAKNVEKYVTNPLNAFLLIKRNTIDLETIEKKLQKFTNDLQVNLENFMKSGLVDHKEVYGAVAGILRLQHTYHLESEDIIEGIIGDEIARNSLTPGEIYVIANESFHMPEYEFYSKSYFAVIQGDLDFDGSFLEEVIKLDISKKTEILKTHMTADPSAETYSDLDIGNGLANRFITRKACRGGFLRSPSVIKNLHCKFVSFSKFSSIAPFKLEEASLEPHIVIYHNMMSDNEIKTVIELSKPQKKTATVSLFIGQIASFERLAQHAWLYDVNHEVVNRLSKRFEDMTGLSMETAEPLQVQNYGIGGQFSAHYDNKIDQKNATANVRLATLMLYVNLN